MQQDKLWANTQLSFMENPVINLIQNMNRMVVYMGYEEYKDVTLLLDEAKDNIREAIKRSNEITFKKK